MATSSLTSPGPFHCVRSVSGFGRVWRVEGSRACLRLRLALRLAAPAALTAPTRRKLPSSRGGSRREGELEGAGTSTGRAAAQADSEGGGRGREARGRLREGRGGPEGQRGRGSLGREGQREGGTGTGREGRARERRGPDVAAVVQNTKRCKFRIGSPTRKDEPSGPWYPGTWYS
eukprot:957177-Rhodomonas_salina.1